MAGELINLGEIPASKRAEMVEGLDYKTDWSFADQAELRRIEWRRNAFDEGAAMMTRRFRQRQKKKRLSPFPLNRLRQS